MLRFILFSESESAIAYLKFKSYDYAWNQVLFCRSESDWLTIPAFANNLSKICNRTLHLYIILLKFEHGIR